MRLFRYFIFILVIADSPLLHCMEQQTQESSLSYFDNVPQGVRNQIAEYRIYQDLFDRMNKNANEKINGMVDFRSLYSRRAKFEHSEFELELDDYNSLWLAKKNISSLSAFSDTLKRPLFQAEGSSIIEKINVFKRIRTMFSSKKYVFCFAISENRKFAMFLTVKHNDETGCLQVEELNTVNLEIYNTKSLSLKNNPLFESLTSRWNTEKVEPGNTARLNELIEHGYKGYDPSLIETQHLFKSKIITAAVDNTGSQIALADHLGITLFNLDKQTSQAILDKQKLDFPGIILFDKSGKRLAIDFECRKDSNSLKIVSIENETADQLQEYFRSKRISKRLPYKAHN